MPLSEEEQRILHEMERKLYENDPGFVSRVRSEPGARNAARACRWCVVAFLVGAVFLVVTFRSSLLLGTLGFLMMLASALFFERSLRQLDGPVFGALSRAVRGRGLGEEISDLMRRSRSHFKHQG